MLTLYQAEWCPHSHLVRERLTELGLDFVARQVPASQADRHAMRAATGEEEIPTLVLDDGSVVSGDEAILDALDRRYGDAPGAGEHRRRAREQAA